MARSAHDMLYNEDGTFKTNQQYIAEIDAIESAALMADLLILKTAIEVIRKWQAPHRLNSAAVAIAECALMASAMSQKLYEDYGIVAS